jgi:hypothetical protein
MPDTFMDRFVSGKASARDIDEEIEIWHTGSHAVGLEEFLGMTKDEYSLWLMDPNALEIIKARRVLAQIHAGDMQIVSIAMNGDKPRPLSDALVKRIAAGMKKIIDAHSSVAEPMLKRLKARE